jgi:outer membrane protein TolC
MEPPVVGKYGKNADGRSLKEMLVGAIIEVAQRRETQGRTTEAEILKLRILRAAVKEQVETAKYSTDDALSSVESKSEVQPTRTDVDQGPLLAPRRDPVEDILQDVDDILNSKHNR